MHAASAPHKHTGSNVLIFPLLVCLIFMGSSEGRAQTSAPATQASPVPSASASPSSAVSPAAQTANPGGQQNISAVAAPSLTPKLIGIDTKRAGLGELVTLRVENLMTLVKQSECVESGPGCQKQEIVLFLNGRPLTGEYPEVILPAEQLVQIRLNRGKGNDDLWGDLLGQPSALTKQVKVSVGLENGYPIEEAQRFDLIIIHQWGFWSCLVLLLILLLSTLYLGRRTSLLRSSSAKRDDNKLYPYSLGSAQMAFWFILVVSSFLLIWLITGEYGTITTSTLVLIGIGAGTALGATLVDNSKSSTAAGQTIDYEAEKTMLTNRINEIKSSLADPNNPPQGASDLQTELDTKQARLLVVNSMLDQLRAQPDAPASKGFFKDILSDSGNGGVSFHRMQIVTWTIVLGIIFINSVYDRLAMPEFSGTLLALMGISSGTYLGFKGTEK